MSHATGIKTVTFRVTDSSRLGTDTANSTHEFTGSVGISGSLKVDGLANLSASYAITASYALNGGGSGSSGLVPISDTAPSSPNTGSMWWDSSIGQLKIWYVDGDNGQWVDAAHAYQSLGGASVGEKWDVSFDGQGSNLSPTTVYRTVTSTNTLGAVTLIGDNSGSVGLTVSRYTPSGGSLGSGTTLGSASLSASMHLRDTTLSGWTKSVTAGDVLSFTITTSSFITRLSTNLST